VTNNVSCVWRVVLCRIGFTLDPAVGEFILTHPNIRCKPKGKVYSINEGNAATWDRPTTEFIAKCKQNGPVCYPLLLLSPFAHDPTRMVLSMMK
jgi:fructose-1,6-bisphosphatase